MDSKTTFTVDTKVRTTKPLEGMEPFSFGRSARAWGVEGVIINGPNAEGDFQVRHAPGSEGGETAWYAPGELEAI